MSNIGKEGDLTSGEGELFPENNNIDSTKLFEYLKKVHSRPSYYSAFFELELHRTGLISQLEADGVVPIVNNPNPYDPETTEEQHEQWWDEHPEEGAKFSAKIDHRELTLLNLYIGSILGKFLKG